MLLKKTYLILILILISFDWAYAGISRPKPYLPSGTKLNISHWLFLIGINEYTSFNHLKTPVQDAKMLKDVLLSKYYFDKDHLIELYDKEATRKNIIDKLEFLAKNASKNDSILIFYAGHCNIDDTTRTSYWVPYDGGKNNASSWISSREIKNYLSISKIKSRHILLISDSCFSGEFFKSYSEKGLVSSDIEKIYMNPSRQLLVSNNLEEKKDMEFEGLSVFSYYLIKSLRENEESYLLPSNFFKKLKFDIVLNVTTLPEIGYLSNAGGMPDSEFIFFLKWTGKPLETSIKKEEKTINELLQEAKVAKKRDEEKSEVYRKQGLVLDKEIESKKGMEDLILLLKEKDKILQRIEEQKKELQENEKKRFDEIEIIRVEKKRKLEKSISNYKTIMSLDPSNEVKQLAWKNLISPYQKEAKDIEIGDIEGLKMSVIDGSIPNSIGMRFVLIYPNENIKKEFYMQTTEVTQKQWKMIMGNNPSKFQDCGESCPVEYVSWYDAQEFTKKLNLREKTNKYRLPSMEEWENACMAGSKSLYCHGDDENELNLYGWYKNNSDNTTHPVSEKKSNPWGLYDMNGNVREWCEDSYDERPLKIYKGGGFDSYPRELTSEYKDSSSPPLKYRALGFRIVKEP
ncbi:MAG: SUMF1/EgtB/PvdO family nonheme iron enzyme [Desulfobacterales bacterium]|nr:SUMF1/EgtB/PvdO family nonheme iron enzyme [Desulfobacterales bacterium]MBF0396511.1 SUMF1/EgtB/PvdO family nonheme iron enzyme [Desulfobacterales bacterium]